jgi:excisionase family DNA binding protein
VSGRAGGLEERETVGLSEVARRLGVHYMTAYRYVRTGRLPARTTGNGRWAVDPGDLAGLRRPRPRGHAAAPRSRAAAMVESRLLSGDEAGAFTVCEAALASWARPEDVYLEIICPALASIGRRWERGQLSVGAEHRASAVASRLVGRLGPRFHARGRKRGTVVVGAAPGDRHALPTAMLADLLRHRGLAVADLGADTPAEAFAEAARSADRLVAVGVVSSLGRNRSSVQAAVAAVHAAVPGSRVLVGGGGLADPEEARRTGADGWSGPDARLALDRLAGWASGAGARAAPERGS